MRTEAEPEGNSKAEAAGDGMIDQLPSQITQQTFVRSSLRCAVVLFGAILFCGLSAPSAHAAMHHRHVKGIKSFKAKGPIPFYRAALLEDADTGKVLYEDNADMQWPPASMAKMMLLLVATEQIKAGRVGLDDPVRVSERSAHTGGSRVGLEEGQIYPLGELMKAAIIKSANDAAVAVAEKVGGSVEATVRMMNQRAEELGMTHTKYQTVDGLPPRPTHDADITTARDLARVAYQIIHTTDLLKWSSQEQAPFDGGVCMLHTTNHLIGHFDGCDGLKTGFTFQAGFNLTATAKRGNLRFISVILGAPSNQQRFAQSAKLLDWGFEHFKSVSVLRSGEPLPVHVQVGPTATIQPIAPRDVNVVLPKTEVGSLHLEYKVPTTINGSLTLGERVGEVLVQDHGETVTEVTVVSPIAVEVPATEQVGATENSNADPAYNQVNQ
jgi:D-alanyl-D-alanine carboxypeptidase (penicillin-binding protein 5/6)